MKKTLTAMALLVSINSFAVDLAEKHAAFCDGPEALAIKGESGSCQVIVSLNEMADQKTGVCVGKAMQVIPCRVTYVMSADATGLQIVCGDDPQKPLLDQTVMGQAQAYNISAAVSDASGSVSIIHDKPSYTFLETSLVGMTFAQANNATSATITLSLRDGDIDLTEVTCF